MTANASVEWQRRPWATLAVDLRDGLVLVDAGGHVAEGRAEELRQHRRDPQELDAGVLHQVGADVGAEVDGPAHCPCQKTPNRAVTLSAPRTHTKAALRDVLLWETPRALKKPREGRRTAEGWLLELRGRPREPRLDLLDEALPHAAVCRRL
jgi:hypothetical protein